MTYSQEQIAFCRDQIVQALRLADTPLGRTLLRRWLMLLSQGTALEILMELFYKRDLSIKQIATRLDLYNDIAKVEQELAILVHMGIVIPGDRNGKTVYNLLRGMPEQDHSSQDSADLVLVELEYLDWARAKLREYFARLPRGQEIAEQILAMHFVNLAYALEGKLLPITLYSPRDYCGAMIVRTDYKSIVIDCFAPHDEWGKMAWIQFLEHARRLSLGYTDDNWAWVYSHVVQSEWPVFREMEYTTLGQLPSGRILVYQPTYLFLPGEVLIPLHKYGEPGIVEFLVKLTGQAEDVMRAMAYTWRSAQGCFYWALVDSGICVAVVGVSVQVPAPELLLPLFASSPDTATRLLEAVEFVLTAAGDTPVKLAVRTSSQAQSSVMLQLGWRPTSENSSEWYLDRSH